MVKGFNCVCFLICAKHANRIIGPRCLAACDATLWDQKAKSQKSTATCQSHSSEFGLWTWNGVRGLIISSLTANGRWRIPTTPAFSSFKKPKKKNNNNIWKNSEREKESVRFLFLGTILFFSFLHFY